MAKPNDWVEFFDGHAPEYESNEFTHNTVADVDFLTAELGLAPRLVHRGQPLAAEPRRVGGNDKQADAVLTGAARRPGRGRNR